MSVVKSKNILVEHWLNVARDKNTDSKLFVQAVENIGACMLSDIISEVKTITVRKDIKTPLKRTKATFIDQNRVYFIPILRAGLAMLGGVKNMLPEARIAHVGLFRTQKTLEPRWYMDKLPKKFAKQSVFIVFEPMLATGGTLSAVLSRMEELGMKNIFVLSMLVSRHAKNIFEKQFPHIKIIVGEIDPILNDKGYIVPGLGDAGDRAFNL